ncbi:MULTISPECIES: dipeptide ABC transporter ATP-binding protein [unclassified Streptomyces]|uniref:dipeptide ABC transporter ATP-binding protein n=1 Tax=unclassified Streptomyces TaxID=2593676 RepID=UPI00035D3303|nr:ABC transporter ATP-binding protein [Streptomyces sp. LaPpAH-202]MYW58235.1 dipeptide ABC transporter ATP-binding protein [Streptomyces sp. SID8370]MYW86646.1 dipeptide ABC transporter ATP-binding protein [Streptomyces sp. SID8371]
MDADARGGAPGTRPDPDPADALLTVRDLRIAFGRGRDRTEVVHGVDLTLRAGECLAVVGESGSGKTLTGRTLAGLTGPGATVTARRLDFDGRDLTTLDERAWRRVRGAEIGLVLQDALVSLDPLRRVGAEIEEALANHGIGIRRDRPERAVELLREVAVPEPEWRARQFPHQLSGGQRQRALIASAIAAGPRLLIADEPTTALDMTVQAQILDLLAARRDAGTALLLISHDLAVVARLADRIAVMHEGRLVETGPAARVLAAPSHPYTRRLLDAVPVPRAAPTPPAGDPEAETGAVVLRAEGLVKRYEGPGGPVEALGGVSCELRAGETLGVLGESGSGKSTLAQVVLGLLEPDEGTVTLFDKPWSHLGERSRAPLRGRIQLVQQDPLSSFDPRWDVERIVAEALGAGGRRDARRHRDRVVELLGLVGLAPAFLGRSPSQLSGGQRQRVAIARALAPEPAVLVCDEPVSALDVSVQAQVLDVFDQVRERLGVALLFISHDLGVVRHISDQVAVMRAGRVVETGPVEQVFTRPAHPWTRQLLDALPRPADGAPAPGPAPSPTVPAGACVPGRTS